MPTESATPGEVTVATIDDHDVVHAGIEAWCADAHPPIRLVGSFSTPGEFLARYPDDTGEVDVVLLDLQIDGNRPEFDALGGLCEAGQRVIVYSHLTADEVILTCLDLGAVTYLAKSEGKRHLIDAIHAAHATTPYVGPRMGKALLDDGSLGRIGLSEREKEVLSCLVKGMSYKLIADSCFISIDTVRGHIRNIYEKLHVHSKSEAVAKAIKGKIV